MAEQLAFEEPLGDRGAVEAHIGAGAARAEVVNRLCDEFLAGAALAAQQHGRPAPRDDLGGQEDLLHALGAADDVRQSHAPADFLAQQLVLLDEGGLLGLDHLVQLHGLPDDRGDGPEQPDVLLEVDIGGEKPIDGEHTDGLAAHPDRYADEGNVLLGQVAARRAISYSAVTSRILL